MQLTMDNPAIFDWLDGYPYKERRTDSHVYFVGGPFSQWWSSTFYASAFPRYPVEKFISAEQFMMAAKALLFQDAPVYEAIMRETNPRTIKELGRKVGNFTKEEWDTDAGPVWDACAQELVYRGNLAKFAQDERLKAYLLATDNLFMVEGASYDEVWGVKLAWDDPAIEDPANWRGKNWLGLTLMRTRKRLLEIEV